MIIANTTKYVMTKEQLADLGRDTKVINIEPFAITKNIHFTTQNTNHQIIQNYIDTCVDLCIKHDVSHALVGGQSFLMYGLCKALFDNGIQPIVSVTEKCFTFDQQGNSKYFFLHNNFIHLKE